MLSNGNSFSNGQSMGSCQGSLMGERRNTEPWFWQIQRQIQPGAAG